MSVSLHGCKVTK